MMKIQGFLFKIIIKFLFFVSKIAHDIAMNVFCTVWANFPIMFTGGII